ncbi:DUF3108 domain-containing protein [Bradyrhizobium sp. 31Argb]|uniref:DUF3108 domain-containing protein n=1 Tax=unclassified Bradyrhizobium TaxID=2631580 RepID=UPI0013EEDE90|nr:MULTISPECIES: DUF3108 domain-containing protein [unclassified Bradyrhizobium]MDI4233546.1 DUF3108 domain-containing protein [Bradyrhizobium sp. Arg237L]
MIDWAGKPARRTIAALMAVAVSGPIPQSAMAATVYARYSLAYLGVRVGEVKTANDIGASSYQADLDAQLTGAARVAMSYKINMKANGLVREGALLPSHFTTSQVGTGRAQSIRVSLKGGNAQTTEIDPPIEDSAALVPLKEEYKQNVVDPVSALILTVPPGDDGVGPSSCNRTLRVFNGVFRADITLSYLRTEQLKTRGYSGPAAVCSARFVPLAGHDPNSSMTKFMVANQGIEVRLAPVRGTSMVMLVSATVPMPLGTGVIKLEEHKTQ